MRLEAFLLSLMSVCRTTQVRSTAGWKGALSCWAVHICGQGSPEKQSQWACSCPRAAEVYFSVQAHRALGVTHPTGAAVCLCLLTDSNAHLFWKSLHRNVWSFIGTSLDPIKWTHRMNHCLRHLSVIQLLHNSTFFSNLFSQLFEIWKKKKIDPRRAASPVGYLWPCLGSGDLSPLPGCPSHILPCHMEVFCALQSSRKLNVKVLPHFNALINVHPAFPAEE